MYSASGVGGILIDTMGLFIRQDENRSQLQERLAAELRERSMVKLDGGEPLDQTKNSSYLKDTEQTSGRAWIFFAVIGIVILAGVLFIITR